MYSITAAGAMIISSNRFLLLKRHISTLHPNMWGMIAGSIEAGEDAALAVSREFVEEINLQIDPSALVFVNQFYYSDFPEVNGNYELTFDLYKLEVPAQFIPELNLEEHTDYRWVTKQEALALPDAIESIPDMLEFL